MAEVIERFPLFPLGIVLLPSELVPLHIFEERYKLMIGECLDEEREFGILWMSDKGLREVGCTARIEQLLERMEDGRMNILTRGTRPFRLLERIPDLPYPAGTIELLDDAAEAPTDDALAEAQERYADLVERVTDKRPEPGDLAELDAYGMAGTIEFAPTPKQELLEERTEAQRIRLLTELLVKTIAKLTFTEKAEELSRSNGKLR
jgi:Lon protease-like protein